MTTKPVLAECALLYQWLLLYAPRGRAHPPRPRMLSYSLSVLRCYVYPLLAVRYAWGGGHRPPPPTATVQEHTERSVEAGSWDKRSTVPHPRRDVDD